MTIEELKASLAQENADGDWRLSDGDVDELLAAFLDDSLTDWGDHGSDLAAALIEIRECRATHPPKEEQ